MQLATPHVLAEQLAVPLGAVQALPHEPQLLTLVVVLTSQPSVFLLALQSPKPALQVPVHVPAEHTGEAMLLFEHTEPHAPQLPALVLMFTSQPSAASPLQSA